MKLKEQLKLQKDIEVPFHVWRMFGQNCKVISMAGNQASLGEDFGSLQELRTAVEWYASQLGGTIKWEKE